MATVTESVGLQFPEWGVSAVCLHPDNSVQVFFDFKERYNVEDYEPPKKPFSMALVGLDSAAPSKGPPVRQKRTYHAVPGKVTQSVIAARRIIHGRSTHTTPDLLATPAQSVPPGSRLCPCRSR